MDGEVSSGDSIGYNEFATTPSEENTYYEALRIFAPQMLLCGMTHEQYWEQDVYLVEEYMTAYMLKRDEESWKAWLGDMYTFDAVSAALSNIHFDKKTHKVNLPQFDKPFPTRPKTEDEEKRDNRKAEEKIIAQLNKLKDKWDNDHG